MMDFSCRLLLPVNKNLKICLFHLVSHFARPGHKWINSTRQKGPQSHHGPSEKEKEKQKYSSVTGLVNKIYHLAVQVVMAIMALGRQPQVTLQAIINILIFSSSMMKLTTDYLVRSGQHINLLF